MIKIDLLSIVQIGEAGYTDHHGRHNEQEYDQAVSKGRITQHHLCLQFQQLGLEQVIGQGTVLDKVSVSVIYKIIRIGRVLHGECKADGQ